jgi:hypothetical protein
MSLPDGRSWEIVSPLEKNGGEINGIGGAVPNGGLPEGGIVQAAANGSAVTYLSLLAFPGTNGEEPLGAALASQYLSTRKLSQWSTEDITTAMNSKTYPAAGYGAPYRAFASDLSKGLMLRGGERPVENPPLTKDAPPRYMNYYLRDGQTGDFSPLLTSKLLTSIELLTNMPREEPGEFRLELLGVTPDLNHSVFETRAALSPGATRQIEGNLYEWTEGRFVAINVPPEAINPGETAGAGAELGTGSNESHAISNDGSRVFWSQPGTSSLFVRDGVGTPQVTTIQVDQSQEGIDAGGGGEFKTASADGSRAFFTDASRLTPDATAGHNAARQDLYMFDIEHRQLTDLTVDGNDPGGAAVLGVLGASEDGSYLYFVAEGAIPGTGNGLSGTAAVARNDNLYVWHEGSERFLFALDPSDSNNGTNREPTVAHDWDKSASLRTARVTADGRLLFMSAARLTSYDNRDASNAEVRDEEVYLYDDHTASLSCLSCNPSGARPAGPSGFPGGTPWRTVPELGTYQPRVLSEDASRVFFDSRDALLPQDTNGTQDVYEWEQKGAGTCQQAGGCVQLLSGAASTSDSSFVDASTSGDDVFFITRAELVGQDTDQLRDLYDARVGGGFPPPVAPLPACEGESCLPPTSSASAPGSLSSATFSGAGNLVPASKLPAKVKVKKVKTKKRGKAKRSGRRASKKRKGHGVSARGSRGSRGGRRG